MATARDLVVVLVATVLVFSPLVAGQSTACVTPLVPCLSYLQDSSKAPGSDCCVPLAAVARTNVTCLCDLAQSAGAAGINVTRALELPVLCNIPNVNANTCGVTLASPPVPLTLPPPPQSGRNENAARSEFVAPLMMSFVFALASALTL